MATRFTSSTVFKVYDAVRQHHDKGPDFTSFLNTALQVGGDIGNGSRYIGMGGRMDVQFGGKGARRAVAYLYGIGVESGAFNNFRNLAEEDPVMEPWFRDVVGIILDAQHDLGIREFEKWTDTGRIYAQRFDSL